MPAPHAAGGCTRGPSFGLGARRLTRLRATLVNQAVDRAGEHARLGRPARADHLLGDGIVLGWHRGRLLQSPTEDNVILFGVQRSGKTSTVVVPTLLGWLGV